MTYYGLFVKLWKNFRYETVKMYFLYPPSTQRLNWCNLITPTVVTRWYIRLLVHDNHQCVATQWEIYHTRSCIKYNVSGGRHWLSATASSYYIDMLMKMYWQRSVNSIQQNSHFIHPRYHVFSFRFWLSLNYKCFFL